MNADRTEAWNRLKELAVKPDIQLEDLVRKVEIQFEVEQAVPTAVILNEKATTRNEENKEKVARDEVTVQVAIPDEKNTIE